MRDLDHVQQLIDKNYGLIKGSFVKNRKLFGKAWEDEFNEVLSLALPDDETRHRCLKGYTEFAVGSMRLHSRFIEDGGRYIEKSYEQSAQEVYQNRDQMMNEYLPGILLSHFLWVHHYRQLMFFQKYFIEAMAQSADHRFHDVGVGTGYMSVQILKRIKDSNGIGWDLSPHSLAHTQKLVGLFNASDRYTIRQQNILTTPNIEQRPFLISVEVLEHLEDPLSFLKGLYNMLEKGGQAFITAAINAPHLDHIYLYRNEQEVLTQIQQAGFNVETVLGAYAYSPNKSIPIVPSAAAVIASK